MGAEQVEPGQINNLERLPRNDLQDLRLFRAIRSFQAFKGSNPQMETIGLLPSQEVADLSLSLSAKISEAILFSPDSSITSSLDSTRLDQFKGLLEGEGNRTIFTRHGEQSPPEWVHSLKDPRLKKIRMMQAPFNQNDLLTNQGMVDVFVTSLGLLYLTQSTGRNLQITSSENYRAKEVAEILTVVVPGASYTTHEGLTSITYLNEVDDPPVNPEDILEVIPSGFMPWQKDLIDKFCKRTKSGLKHSEAIEKVIGEILEVGLSQGNDLKLVLTHSQQLAEVLRQKGVLSDPAIRFPELSMMVVNPQGLYTFPRGVVAETPQKELKKEEQKYIYAFSEVDDRRLAKVGGKGANLVLLKKMGLNVPDGYCITTDAHLAFVETGNIPEGLVGEVKKIKKELGGKIAIRSSADCEDGTDLSMAGVFKSEYIYNDQDVERAILEIYSQAHSKEVAEYLALQGKSGTNVKMGLVVQKLIEPDVSGVIYTGLEEDRKLIQYVDGFGAKLVDGDASGSAMVVSKSGFVVDSAGFETRPIEGNLINKLADLANQIQSFLGPKQDIEFAVQDGRVYLLQARALTADLGSASLQETPQDILDGVKAKLRKMFDSEKKELGTQNAILSDANYSELLPRPTEMDIGIYMYIWGGDNGIPGAKQIGHELMGYQTEGGTGIIKYVGGRTYASVARYAAIYHAGFPESKDEYFQTLVAEYLQKIQDDPEKGAYPQMGLFLQDPKFDDLQNRFGDRAGEYYGIYQLFAQRMRGFADEFARQFKDQEIGETDEFVQQKRGVDLNGLTAEQIVTHTTDVLEHLRTRSYVNFVKAARLGFYYSQHLQDLLEQKLGLDKDQAKIMYSNLNKGLPGSLITEANIAIAKAHSEEEAVRIAGDKVGHFNTGEMLEIRHTPLRDNPEALLNYVRGIRNSGDYKGQLAAQQADRLNLEKKVLEGLPEADREKMTLVLKASQTYMALRESVKYLFTKEYLVIRDALEALNTRLALEPGDVYFLYPRELPNLVSDPDSMGHIIRSRRRSFIAYQDLNMPKVIRESDIDSLNLKGERDEAFEQATGKFLADGSIIQEGIVLNLDEFPNLDEAKKTLDEYKKQELAVIVVATQMNLSHDPFIARAEGLIIENAGIVAHGAQRARELGKGAIGGIKTGGLNNGMKVSFNPKTREVKRIN